MENEKLKELFEQFLKVYDFDLKNSIWDSQSKQFKSFWYEKILQESITDIADQEIDDIVKILDTKGKGNTKNNESIAAAMIPQGAWRRMFNELSQNKDLSKIIDNIFIEKNVENQVKLINKLYLVNEGKKNNLTGQSGNAINCLRAAYDPFNNLSIISIKDRIKLIEYFSNNSTENILNLNIGERIIRTDKIIKKIFEDAGITYDSRTISAFCYSPLFKSYWKDYSDVNTIISESILEENSKDLDLIPEANGSNNSLFYMENHLEDFLIKNWDKTELGKKYDLIEENGDLKSQQYNTNSIGVIDILVKNKQTDEYVVIELKRDQTSDKTVGQLLRYIGWVEENLSKGKNCNGIIIAAYFDEKLKYAIRKLPFVEVFSYKIEFKLEEFKNIL